MGCKVNISSYRHIVIAISRRFLPKSVQFVDLEDSSDDKDDEVTSALDAQATHSSYVAQLVYGREANVIAGSLSNRYEQFRTVSKAWHSFLGCDGPAGLDVNINDYHPTKEDVVRRWALLRHSSPITQLHTLLGPQAVFRAKQEEVLRAIYDGVSPILAIMPPGSGKSMAFLLPASYEFSGTTVVVVPLLALQQDLLHRTVQHSIPARIWEPRLVDQDVKILFITPESARTTEFLSYFHRLRTTGQVDRIVFDECHMFTEGEITFRPAIRDLINLFQFHIRLVFLTATLAVQQERTFWELLGLQHVPTRTIRANTIQPNLQYIVKHVPSSKRIQLIREYVRALRKGKMIVYCRYKRSVVDTAAQLGCNYYFSSYEKKTESLEQFRTTDCSIIVATNALGLGLDIPDIRVVIHYDTPDDLVTYVQESGRAGRDGQLSTCILCTDPQISSPILHRQSYEVSGSRTLKRCIQQYVTLPAQGQCRRQTIYEHLDGNEGKTTCKDTPQGLVYCDVCTTKTKKRPLEPSYNQTPADLFEFDKQQRKLDLVRQEVQATRIEGSAKKELILRFIETLRTRCYRCMGSGQDGFHLRIECSNAPNSLYQDTIDRIRRSIKFDRYSGCFTCGMPQEFCQTFVQTPKGFVRSRDQKECTVQTGLFDAAAALVYDSGERILEQNRLYERLGIVSDQGSDRTRIVQSLGRKVRWFGWETNLLFQATAEWYINSSQ
ncbi:MAG: helicase-related protein [Janthinobacterium lividum]